MEKEKEKIENPGRIQVLPFHKTQEDAVQAYQAFYSNRPLLPRIFLKESHIQEMQGGYVPYFLISGTADVNATYEAQDTTPAAGPGKIRKIVSDYRVVRKATVDYFHLPVNASGQIPESFMKNLEPFRLKELIPAEDSSEKDQIQDFLSSSIQKDPEVEQKRVSEIMSGILKDSVHHSYVKEERINADYQNEKEQCVLFPVYLLTTKCGNRYFHFGMNGQTGKVYGDLPVSYPHLTALFMGLFVGGAAAVWGILRLLFFLARMPVSAFVNNIFLLTGLFAGLIAANHVISDRYEKMRKPAAPPEKKFESCEIRNREFSDILIRKQYTDRKNIVIREETGSQTGQD